MEKEKRVSSVCSHLKWWSSPKRWVQTFAKRGSLWFLAHYTPGTTLLDITLLSWGKIIIIWMVGTAILWEIMSKYIVQRNLSTFYYGFVAFLTVIICPYIEMEKDCVNWIYQQLTWKNDWKYFTLLNPVRCKDVLLSFLLHFTTTLIYITCQWSNLHFA